ncbi:hypothetical protein [Agromyces archimandritae]|uniref:Holin n=1 Tax=Agromyces archimandritae TaxID=2781962 RepID=A0A975FL49_9MICO|nr:hypothetical protein [Agromyces archimandritae]QTX04104.1 hypothetical protein G127AT_12495 [Agromyces archimandritae]
MATISPKVNAAAGGAAVAASVTTIAAWMLRQLAGVELPADVQGAITVVLAAAGAWIAGYAKSDGKHEA